MVLLDLRHQMTTVWKPPVQVQNSPTNAWKSCCNDAFTHT